MSVYKDDESRRVMAEWYERFLAQLPFPVQHSDVETSYGRTHVLAAGPQDAPPLVCFHGVMSSAAASFPLIAPLVKHFRVIIPDTVGQVGRSEETYLPLKGDPYGRWAAEVIDGLRLGPVPVLGASMGGYIGLKLAEYYPEKVSALALWCPGGLVNGAPLAGMRLMWRSLSLYLWPNERKLRRLFDDLFTDFDETWFQFYGDSMSLLKMDRRMPELCGRTAFRDLKAPVLLLVNEDDLLFPAAKLVERAREILPNLQHSEVLKGFRHVPPFLEGRTSEPLAKIARFIQGHGVRAAAEVHAS